MPAGEERILRRRIRSIESTQKITRALELIAASRIVRAQQAIVAARPYTERMEDVVAEIARDPVPAPGGRHWNPVEPYAMPNTEAPSARHATDNNQFPPPAPIAEPAAAHGGSDNAPHPDSQHGEGHGQSVAELLARLQAGAGPTGGGRRRRRDG